MREDGENGGWRRPRGKPRGTVAMREEAGLGRERTGEDGRGRDGSELAEVEGVGGGGEDEGGGGELVDVECLCEAFGM